MVYNEKAYKCARAFVNTHADILSLEIITSLSKVRFLFFKNKQFFLLLNNPCLKTDHLLNFFTLLFDTYKIPLLFNRLVLLLYKRKMLTDFAVICFYIEKFYKNKHNIVDFSVTSASVLSDDQKEKIKQFLTKKIRKNSMCSFSVDESLIAGICCQSETFLWQHSVRSQLDKVQKKLMQ